MVQAYAVGNMEMVPQPTENGVEFLESRVNVSDDGKFLFSEYFNKNAPWMERQKIVRYKNYLSFGDMSFFRSVVISTLQRVVIISSNMRSAILSILEVFREFRFLNYPISVLKNALKNRLEKDLKNELIWKILLQLLG